MKKFFLLCLCSALCLLFVPLTVYNLGTAAEKNEAVPELHTAFDAGGVEHNSDSINVYITNEGVSKEIAFRDYIIGAVAAEMPIVFEKEALSAQALACATLAKRKIAEGGDSNLNGAVISTDFSKHQAYMDKEEMKKRWGKDFDKYYKKLCAAVDEVVDYEITYAGEPIIAVFHAINTGKTESAENVWQTRAPYLVSVESEGDSLSPKFSSNLVLSRKEFLKKMEENGVKLSENADEWFGESSYSDAGALLKISIGANVFSGEDLRKIFSLRSAAIKINLDGDNVVFNVKGYGHGVGLSQYGADYYARQGKNWREIIEHYYPGTNIAVG